MDSAAQNKPPAPAGRYRLAPITTQHVENSYLWIEQAASEVLRPGSVLVLGAGPCSDIPLAALLTKFKRVVLNDFDAALLAEGVARLPPHIDRERIELRICDLTAPAALLAETDRIIAAAPTAPAALEQLTAAIASFQVPAAEIQGQHDLVIASCLLSQLHVMSLQKMLASFRQRFTDNIDQLSAAARWKAALYDLARRMEHRFIDQLYDWLAPQGRCYLSETVQLCYVQLASDGMWETEGSYRMTKSTNLADYLDDRFRVLDDMHWQRIDAPPTLSGPPGRLYDVHALLLTRDE